jgi:hypothetical protein
LALTGLALLIKLTGLDVMTAQRFRRQPHLRTGDKIAEERSPMGKAAMPQTAHKGFLEAAKGPVST